MESTFGDLLPRCQKYIAQHYAAALADHEKFSQLRSYIEKYLRETDSGVQGLSMTEVTDKLYREMAEYSVLTPYFNREDVEEINVNAWNDIAITYVDGRIEKTAESFMSPQHAVDIIKRLLHHSGMVIDTATPMAQGHLPGHTRITALMMPIVDNTAGISASIRLLHPSRVTKEQLIRAGSATPEMIDFLCVCLRYGVSMIVAGATSSGKTTLLNALLGTIPDEKRIYTIESGSRELSLVRDRDGKPTNNIIHTLSRPSDSDAFDITQEDLVVSSLRFNPGLIVVGEMRDIEAYAAVEASLTGHTVASTIHSGPAAAAHLRLTMLCEKRFDLDFTIAKMQAAQAFPLIVYTHQLEDATRKIMDISECTVDGNGLCTYRTIYRYVIDENTLKDGKTVITGHFESPEPISDELCARLLRFGAPREQIERFRKGGASH